MRQLCLLRPPPLRPSCGRFAVAAVVALLGASCATPTPEPGRRQLRILTHAEFAFPFHLIDEMEERVGTEVVVVTETDADALVATLVATSENPIADVVVGIDSLSAQRALDSALLAMYEPVGIERVDAELRPDGRLTPITYRDVCLNYDISFFEPVEPVEPADEGVTVPRAPRSVRDLASEEYADLLVVPDPATSREGRWFALSLWSQFGEQRWLGVLADLRTNGMAEVETWRDAYFGRFTKGNADGDRPVVLATAAMPGTALSLAGTPPEVATTAAIDDGCLRVVDYAGVVASSQDRRNAGRLVDFMLTAEFQFDVTDDRGSRPARTDVITPEPIDQYGLEPTAPLIPDIAVIGEVWPSLVELWHGIDSVSS